MNENVRNVMDAMDEEKYLHDYVQEQKAEQEKGYKVYLITRIEQLHGALSVLFRDHNPISIDYISDTDFEKLRDEHAIIVGKVPFYLFGKLLNLGIPYIHATIQEDLPEDMPFIDKLRFTYVDVVSCMASHTDYKGLSDILDNIFDMWGMRK